MIACSYLMCIIIILQFHFLRHLLLPSILLRNMLTIFSTLLTRILRSILSGLLSRHLRQLGLTLLLPGVDELPTTLQHQNEQQDGQHDL